MTTHMIIALTLKNQDKGWVFETIDIKAAFLEGSIEEFTFMEWLPGSVKLGYISKKERKNKCIRLKKSIYGNVDAALCFYNTYAKHLTVEMHMDQSKGDSCLFILQDKDGKAKIVSSIHVNDTQIAGTPKELKKFKEGMKTQFKIKEFGEMKKHLGTKYN